MSWARRQLRRLREGHPERMRGRDHVDPELVADRMDMLRYNSPTVLAQVDELEAHGKSIDDFVFFIADMRDPMGGHLARTLFGNRTLVPRSFPGRRPTILAIVPLFDAAAILDKAGCHGSGHAVLAKHPPRTVRVAVVADGGVRMCIGAPDQLAAIAAGAPVSGEGDSAS
jgi:hypothetical protein